MIAEKDRERIKEFFELKGTDFTLRKYHKPVLVYEIADDKVRYSLWEEDLLNRFGLKNVDGWDATENVAFCPDWMLDNYQDEDLDDMDFDDDDDDLDLSKLDLDDLDDFDDE